ncbi:predicted protein [Uncinocarpus reesii 1704]|uniref:Uncharacterized protein n=1 Tax=Uncinocarpus reesii (strain UAMH 1704) TaxID=336963 RepID=C4JZ11_UNCRE|nr:uncharacterized protein UREG_07412 [Uncinocarpus reesii 1704]EEP82547.1 predicted protein [Uncinocarpus reesii 1704]
MNRQPRAGRCWREKASAGPCWLWSPERLKSFEEHLKRAVWRLGRHPSTQRLRFNMQWVTHGKRMGKAIILFWAREELIAGQIAMCQKEGYHVFPIR